MDFLILPLGFLPFLLPLAVSLLAGGAVVGAIGSIQQGKAQSAMAKFQAQQAEENAKRAQQNAAAEAEAEVGRQKYLETQKRSSLATQRAALASSGLMLSGSALDVMSDSDLNFELQKADSRQQSGMRRMQMLDQSRDLVIDSQLQMVASKNARTGSYYGAAGTLLSGAGQAAAVGSSGSGKKADTRPVYGPGY
jgi:hypothetical protein